MAHADLTPPPSLKSVVPFFQRAKECDAKYPSAAYWCRMYGLISAMDKMKEPGFNDPNAKSFILSLMDNLEKDKKKLTDLEEGFHQLSGLALMFFTKADNEDRAEAATKMTARGFFVASTLLEACKQFDDYDDDLEQKRRYSKFKAADIIKAINSGVKPVAGPPAGEEDDDETPPQQQQNHQPPPATHQAPVARPPPQTSQPPAQSIRPTPTTTSTSSSSSSSNTKKLSFEDVGKIEEARKSASLAVSALSFSDVHTALTNLKKAIHTLESLQ